MLLNSANEGDAREYYESDDEDGNLCFADVTRARTLRNAVDYENYSVGDLSLSFSDLDSNARLGRLNVSTTDGIDPVSRKSTSLHAFGARSLSIWSAEGELVWDSGDAIEQITARIQEESGKLVSTRTGSRARTVPQVGTRAATTRALSSRASRSARPGAGLTPSSA